MNRTVILFLALCLLGTAGWAQGGSGYLNLNVGLQTGTEGFRQDSPSVTLPGTTLLAGYTVDDSTVFDLGGGYVFDSNWGVGATVTYTSQSESALAGADVQIAGLPGQPIVRLGPTEADADRSETGVHLHVLYAVRIDENWTLSLYGGPSWFSVSQDMISSIEAGPEGPPLAVDTRSVDESDWGYNIGADFAYYFNDKVGMGVGLRYARATVDVENLIGTAASGMRQTTSTEAGGSQAVIGLRLRFE